MAIVSKYSLNWNSNDSAGANNGSDSNITYVDWKLNQAASFNGTNSVIIISHNAKWWNSLTYNIWVYNNNTNNKVYICESWSAFAYIGMDTSKLQLWNSTTSSSFATFNSTQDIPINKWVMLTYTFNSWDWLLKWYIDWVEVISVSRWWNQRYNNIQQNTIWSYANLSEYHDWLIDEVEIHNTALSAAEVKNKYLELVGFFTYW
jgi:hypothetical protein